MIATLLRLWAPIPKETTVPTIPPSDNVISLAEHQRQCCEEADTLIGLAQQLRSALRRASPSLPLPDREQTALLHALGAFIAASQEHER